MQIKLEIGNSSDVGKVRTINEDYYGAFSGEFGELIIVCDGMGGHEGGEIASRTAVNKVKEHFEKFNSVYNVKEEIEKAIREADQSIKEKAKENKELNEMGSTLVLLLIKDKKAITAHLGDSRIYLIRNDQIYQVTKDHSLVQEMIDSKMISEQTAKSHPKKNVITRSLGASGSSEPDIDEPIAIFKGDTFILCTDGLTEYLDDNELLKEVSENSPLDACGKLIKLANDRGGKDNITVQIVEVIKGKRLPKNTTLTKKILLLVISIILLLIIAFFIKTQFEKEGKKGIEVKEEIKVKDKINNKADSVTNSLQVDSIGKYIKFGEDIDQKIDSIITQ